MVPFLSKSQRASSTCWPATERYQPGCVAEGLTLKLGCGCAGRTWGSQTKRLIGARAGMMVMLVSWPGYRCIGRADSDITSGNGHGEKILKSTPFRIEKFATNYIINLISGWIGWQGIGTVVIGKVVPNWRDNFPISWGHPPVEIRILFIYNIYINYNF
jgi:hypothetical protein